ncbi:putative efflux protein, MATE family [Dethiosulfatibacter aminovorans DSM 17477]|uniref:Putative efflux protein, MATE family n=1 Tax=Dethiosulfatibacter aminovorans DSM 17477 TaxID=1121476 RepID=A0A1M6AHQ9_9FIRM|nr:MATE family efflux transporter [Dethiosulfatibacter aminovorans]SHI36029.1 putative efflux protein, MATE family [Dethiosulfatibacter aminovorans DSM 17477]
MVTLNDKSNNKIIYNTMLTIALPVIIQHLISIGLNLVDTVMIGRLGEPELAAVGIANRFFMIFGLFCFGFYSGCSVFISQYWGIKDIKNIRKVFGIEIISGFSVAILFSTLALVFPHVIMRIFIKDPVVIDYGIQYLRIIGLAYIFIAISFALSYNSRSIHRVKMTVVINTIAISINTFLNYVLIYGKFGFPQLGVRGAAIATVIARFLEFVLLLYFIYKDRNHPLAGSFRELFDWDRPFLMKVYKTAFPVFVNEASWVLGTSIYYIAYGMVGTDAVATVQVSMTISDFFQSFFFGIGSACGVMIGNELGRDNKDLAYSYGISFIKLTAIASIVTGLLLYSLKNPIINFYDFKESTNYMLEMSLIVFSLFMLPKMLTYMIIVGVLRSGGDTRYCMLLDLFFIWLVGIPLAFISVLVMDWPIHLVLAAVFSEEIIKVFVVSKRINSRKWLNNLVS